MKTSEQFLKAKNDKSLSALLIVQREGQQYMRLCIDAKIPYTDKTETVFIETPTEIRIENFSGSYCSATTEKREINSICFHESVYRNGGSPVITFLSSIKKDSDVKFKVIAYNGCDLYNDLGLVHHSVIGIIDGVKYFKLTDYVGRDNSASPIR